MSKIALLLLIFIEQQETEQMIIDISYKKGFTYEVSRYALAIAHQESNATMPQINGDGGKSIGVFQIKEIAAKQYCKHLIKNKKNLFDKELNIECGLTIIKKLLDKHKDPRKAIAAYNAGSPKYRDGKFINNKYVKEVLNRMK